MKKRPEKVFEEKKQKVNKLKLLEEKVKREALYNPLFFIQNYVITIDEHDINNPFKRFPDKEYLWNIVKIWNSHDLILIAKSRQMMVSWLMVALHVWLAIRPGARIFFVSKKEADADALKERAHFIVKNLPDFLRPEFNNKYCKLYFPALNSEINAVSQDSDALRQYTATAILFDEMAFADEARAIYTAAKPTIVGGGKFTGISTPNGKNFFYELAYDKI
ncbi:MAG: terminase family protein [Candidatus Caldatribacteriota bacterium]